MKKYLWGACILALCMVFLTIIASAHSGRTDSHGGHTNSSTGEYHYHHGYSAHQHYDMDGDGDLDCPYEFDDETNYNDYGKDNHTKETSFTDVLGTIFSIIGLSLAALGVGIVTYVLPLLHKFLMFPIEALVKKLCKEDRQESILNKVSTIMVIFIVIIVVTIVTIIVL